MDSHVVAETLTQLYGTMDDGKTSFTWGKGMVVHILREDWETAGRNLVKVWNPTNKQEWDTWKRHNFKLSVIGQRIDQLAQGIREEPDERCCICHVKAPKKVTNKPEPGNIMGLTSVLRPDLTGWLLMFFPYWDFRHQETNPRVDTWSRQFHEAKRACPPCAVKVQKILHHLTTPYTDGVDE